MSSPLLWTIAVAALFVPGAPCPAPPEWPAALPASPAFRLDRRAFDADVRDAMRRWRVPGAAVVVVQGGRVEYLAGHGPGVTPDTIFPIASCSKAFAVEAIARLVAEGRMGWDDPVRRHLAGFRLFDPDADSKVTLRDLLSHRTGVGSHDLLWYHAPWSPEDAVRRVQDLAPSKPFRTTRQYQSTMFTAAGLAVARAEGKPWGDVLRDRFLVPLGMTRTSPTYPGDAVPNQARPHRLTRAGVEPMPRYPLDVPNPAGTMHSTARDLGAWLRSLLAGNPRREMWTEQIEIVPTESQKPLFPATRRHGYGLGWVVQDYHGLALVSHGGAIDGFRAHIALIPSRRLGIAILTNLDQTPMPLPLASTLLDRILSLPPTDWHALHEAHQQRVADEARQAMVRRFEGRPTDARSPRPLSAYAGTYRHPAYDDVTFVVRAGKLVCAWRGENAEAIHVRGEAFVLVSGLLGTADVVFTPTEAKIGGRLGVTMTRP